MGERPIGKWIGLASLIGLIAAGDWHAQMLAAFLLVLALPGFFVKPSL